MHAHAHDAFRFPYQTFETPHQVFLVLIWQGRFRRVRTVNFDSGATGGEHSRLIRRRNEPMRRRQGTCTCLGRWPSGRPLRVRIEPAVLAARGSRINTVGFEIWADPPKSSFPYRNPKNNYAGSRIKSLIREAKCANEHAHARSHRHRAYRDTHTHTPAQTHTHSGTTLRYRM